MLLYKINKIYSVETERYIYTGTYMGLDQQDNQWNNAH